MNKTLSIMAMMAAITFGHLQPAMALPTGKPITMDMRHATVLEVIRVLSEISGENIITSEKASLVKISVYLKDVQAKNALDAISKAGGLWYRYDANTNIYRVMTTEEYQQDIVVFRPETTKVITVRNSNVVTAANAIKSLYGQRVSLVAGTEDNPPTLGGGSGVVSSTGSGGTTSSTVADTVASSGSGANTNAVEIKDLAPGQISALLNSLSGNKPNASNGAADVTTEDKLANNIVRPPNIFVTYVRLHNLLIVRSSDNDALTTIESLVKDLDRPTRQVLLEMKVLEVKLGDSFRSAFDFSYAGVGITPPVTSPEATTSTGTNNSTAPNTFLGLGNFPTEGGSFIFQKFISDNIRLRIQALASDNKVKTLATPLLLASNNQRAKLFIGEERIMTTGVTANTVTNNNTTNTIFTAQTEKRNIGNTLEIIPRINDDHTVSLSILQDSSTVLPKSTSIPVGSNGQLQEFPIDTVNTSNISVNVVAADRLAVAIGGMIRESASNGETKVPVLGDVPILGHLFKRQERSKSNSELVLIITPYIIDEPSQGSPITDERLRSLTKQPDTKNMPQGSEP